MIQWMLVIQSLVPWPFLNPICTSRSSEFKYCWSLAWRILSITLLACEMSALVKKFKHPLALPLEKAMATHSSTLTWKIPWKEEPGRLQSMGSLRVRQDWVTSLALFTFMHWRRKWQPTPVFLPGEYQGLEKPSGLPSMGSHRVEHDWSDVAAAAAVPFFGIVMKTELFHSWPLLSFPNLMVYSVQHFDSIIF